MTSTADAGLAGADDVDHIAFALADRRVIYTNNEDYLISIGEIIRFLALLHACLSADEMHGAVEFA